MLFNGMRYLQEYDQHGLEILGTASRVQFDNRKNNEKAVWEHAQKTVRQFEAWKSNPNKYVKPRAKYVKVYRGNDVVQETTMLHDLF